MPPGGSGVPAKKLTPSEIGRDWGTSRAYASKCIGKGCPTDSLDAARRWRVEHSKYGVGYRSKGGAGEGGSPVAPVSSPTGNAPKEKERGGNGTSRTELRDLSSIEASLCAAIEVEQEAHRLVIEAQKAKTDTILSVRIAAYSKAQANRLEAEERVQKYLLAQNILVPFTVAKAEARKGYDAIIPQLRALSKNAGPLCNPENALRATRILEQQIEAIIAQAAKEYAA